MARSQEIIVRELVWQDLDAYRSLWHWLSRHDLVGRVHWPMAPVDDPAPLLLAEPRLLHTKDNEGMWTRIVDIASAIEGRGYSADGSLSLELDGDTLAPWNNGRWQIDVDSTCASAKPTNNSADIKLSMATLSLLYMGTFRPRELYARGLISGSAKAIATADSIFATAHRPHCPDHF